MSETTGRVAERAARREAGAGPGRRGGHLPRALRRDHLARHLRLTDTWSEETREWLVVLDRRGGVRWSYVGSRIGDYPSLDEVRSVLASL